MIKNLASLIETKTHLAFGFIGTTTISSFVLWLTHLTPLIAFFTAILGLIAAAFTVVIKWRELRKKK